MSNDLCEEMVVEIFSRLPSKSLLRFMTVSKSLCACIRSPRFIRLHAQRSPKKFMFTHQVPYNGVRTKIIYTIHSKEQLSSYDGITPVDSPFRYATYGSSCNGIICVYDRLSRAIHLWNPTIRRKAIVPDLSNWDDCLAYGFGFDPIIDDYKILRTSKQGTFVYTMKMNTWREIASPATSFSRVCTSHFLLNGSLYWIVEEDLNNLYCRDIIMTFDLSSEVFYTIELPEPNGEAFELTTIEGCLGVTYKKEDGERWIWARKAIDASWYVAFKLNTRERTTHDDSLFIRCYSKGIVVFNPNSGPRSTLTPFTDSSCIVGMVPCIESLELLNTGTTCDQTNKTDDDDDDDDDLRINIGCCVS